MHPQSETELTARIEAFIRTEQRPYKMQAYLFVFGALAHTVENLGRHQEKEPVKRHVSGQELSFGMRDYAKAQFGPTARLVLAHWGMHKTSDFGRLVYDLIAMGLLGRNDNDRIEDFENVYDLDEELVAKYTFKVPGKPRPPVEAHAKA